MKKTAKYERKTGVSVKRVIENALANASNDVLPLVNEEALRRMAQRVVECPGADKWPCQIDTSRYG